MTSKHTMTFLGRNKNYITITVIDNTTYIDGHDTLPLVDAIKEYYSKLCPKANKVTTTIYKKLC